MPNDLRAVFRRYSTLLTLALLFCALPARLAAAATAPGGPQGAAAPADVLNGPFGEAQIDAMIAALARAGVGTYDDRTLKPLSQPQPPVSPVRLTRFQVRSMAAEVASGSGIAAGVLNTAVRPVIFRGDGGQRIRVPASALVAAWLSAADGPAVMLARTVMPDFEPKDYRDARYPALVLTLFAADGARTTGAAARESYRPRLMLASATIGRRAVSLPSAGLCGEAQELLDDLAGLGTRLAGSDSGVFGWIASGLTRIGIEIAMTAVKAQLAAVRTAMSGMAAAAYAASLLRPWSVTVVVEPASAHHQVEGEAPVEGQFIARVAGGEGASYPEWLRECAALVDLPLPEGQRADGAPISWTTASGFDSHLAARGTADAAVKADGTARFPFRMREEPRRAHAGGERQEGTAAVQVRIERRLDSDRVTQLLAGVTGLPGTVVRPVGSAAGEGGLTDIIGTGTLPLTFHGGRAATIRLLMDAGSGDTIAIEASNCDGLYGTWSGTMRQQYTWLDMIVAGGTDISFTIPDGAKTARAQWSWVSGPGAMREDHSVSIAVGGTREAPTLTFTGTRTVTVTGGRGPHSAALEEVPPFGQPLPVTFEPNPRCR